MYSSEGLNFRKSSYSNPQNCVEVADLPKAAALRDSQNPRAGHLTIPAEEWAAFLSAVREGEL